MKYKVGDKVKVRDDLEICNFYGGYMYDEYMSHFRGKEVTIKDVSNGNTFYTIREDVSSFYRWTDEMFEDETATEAETAKFRAFLEEVANLDAEGYNEEYATLVRIIEYGHDGYDGYDYKECVDNLCDFYRTFTPKVEEPRKKMTLEQIEDALGYKIEIVEE